MFSGFFPRCRPAHAQNAAHVGEFSLSIRKSKWAHDRRVCRAGRYFWPMHYRPLSSEGTPWLPKSLSGSFERARACEPAPACEPPPPAPSSILASAPMAQALLQRKLLSEDPLDHDLVNRFAMVDLEPFATGDLEAVGVEAHKTQNRGVDIGYIMPVLHGVEPEFIRGTVHDASFDPAARQPCAEALRMMIASGPFGTRSAAKLSAEDDDGIFQQAALLEILE